MPSYGKADVLFEALSKSKDLEVELFFDDQRHPGHIKSRTARRLYNSLVRALDNAIITERERANQEKQQSVGKKVLDQYRAPSTKPAAPAPKSQANVSSQAHGQGKNGGGKGGKGKGQGQKCNGGKSGGRGDKDAKPGADEGKGRGPGRLRRCVHSIYSKCNAKECIYAHTHPLAPEEKEHYKALYKAIFSRSRSQSPAPNKTCACAATGRRATALTGRTAS